MVVNKLYTAEFKTLRENESVRIESGAVYVTGVGQLFEFSDNTLRNSDNRYMFVMILKEPSKEVNNAAG